MKRVVADTSALISISLSGKLRLAVQNILFFVPNKVKVELEEMSEFKDPEGNSTKQILSLIKENKIQLVAVKQKEKARQLVDKNIDFGEAECFILAKEKQVNTILMDDVNAAYSLSGFAKSKNISIKISVSAIVELIKTKKLSKNHGVKSMKKMIQYRQWEREVMKQLIDKHIKKFN